MEAGRKPERTGAGQRDSTRHPGPHSSAPAPCFTRCGGRHRSTTTPQTLRRFARGATAARIGHLSNLTAETAPVGAAERQTLPRGDCPICQRTGGSFFPGRAFLTTKSAADPLAQAGHRHCRQPQTNPNCNSIACLRRAV